MVFLRYPKSLVGTIIPLSSSMIRHALSRIEAYRGVCIGSGHLERPYEPCYGDMRDLCAVSLYEIILLGGLFVTR
jgi:hypothetical protein